MLAGATAYSEHWHEMDWCLGIIRGHAAPLAAFDVRATASGCAVLTAGAAVTVIAAMSYGRDYHRPSRISRTLVDHKQVLSYLSL